MTKKLYVSRHVTFLERLLYFTLPPKAILVAKEDLIRIDLFPIDVPTEEYTSTLEVSDIHIDPSPTSPRRAPIFPFS